jgi:type II secretory pathway pseudopilin PulG
MRKPVAVDGQAGASRVELAVAIAVVGVLAAALLERLLYIEEYAEKTAMELTIANMQAGLRARVGSLLIADQASKIPTLAGANPVEWLDHAPENYLGELDAAPAREPKGQWYFDRGRRELVYTANNRLHFSPSVYRDFSVRLRVMPMLGAARPAGTKPAGQQDWVTLVVVNDYRWF